MSFTDRLLLWLHVGFAIFTLGPVAAAMMATPRYIKARDLAVLRYLCRTTGIFGTLSVGVLLFGLLLGRNRFDQAWLTASMTLFIVSAPLLALVFRDQRRAINAVAKELAAGQAVDAAAGSARTGAPARRPAEAVAAEDPHAASRGDTAAAGTAGPAPAPGQEQAAPQPGGTAGPDAPAESAAGHPPAGPAASQVATVERGRIASMAGLVTAIWLVILVLMVWHG